MASLARIEDAEDRLAFDLDGDEIDERTLDELARALGKRLRIHPPPARYVASVMREVKAAALRSSSSARDEQLRRAFVSAFDPIFEPDNALLLKLSCELDSAELFAIARWSAAQQRAGETFEGVQLGSANVDYTIAVRLASRGIVAMLSCDAKSCRVAVGGLAHALASFVFGETR